MAKHRVLLVRQKIVGLFFLLEVSVNTFAQLIETFNLDKDYYIRDNYTKEYLLTIDSMKVNGFVNEDNMDWIRYSSLYGNLRGVDFSEATFEDNAFPARAFLTFYANTNTPSRVYNNEGLYDEDNELDKKGGWFARVKYVTLPEGLEALGVSSFANSHLAMLELPGSVKYFWDCSIDNCRWLRAIKVHYRSFDGIHESSGFREIPETVTLMVPKGTKAMYEQDERWKAFKTIVEYDDLSSVNTVEMNVKNVDGNVYTLDGRCRGTDVEKLDRGIYIVNGKKIAK